MRWDLKKGYKKNVGSKSQGEEIHLMFLKMFPNQKKKKKGDDTKNETG